MSMLPDRVRPSERAVDAASPVHRFVLENALEEIMSVRLSRRSYEHARKLIENGAVVLDERDDWSVHQPSTRQENEFISEHGFNEYQKWYLGISEDDDEDDRKRYRFPYGDFSRVHLCGVLTAESRAGRYKYFDIEWAVAHLHGMLDALMSTK
nr:hypothetical protein [Protofrankia sp. BMG5.30]